MLGIFQKHALWLWPLLGFILLTPLLSEWDLELSSYFFKNGSFTTNPLFDFLEKYGTHFAIAVWGVVTLLYFISLKKVSLLSLRKVFLVVSLTYLLGAGIVGHLVLKEFWGRPRPKQITQFGGEGQFRPYYSPSYNKEYKSFPSGHSMSGFYCFCLFFLGRRLKKPTLQALGLFAAFFLGTLMSYARIAQGGHFLSDTLFSMLLMWQASYFADFIVFEFLEKRATVSENDH